MFVWPCHGVPCSLDADCSHHEPEHRYSLCEAFQIQASIQYTVRTRKREENVIPFTQGWI